MGDKLCDGDQTKVCPSASITCVSDNSSSWSQVRRLTKKCTGLRCATRDDRAFIMPSPSQPRNLECPIDEVCQAGKCSVPNTQAVGDGDDGDEDNDGASNAVVAVVVVVLLLLAIGIFVIYMYRKKQGQNREQGDQGDQGRAGV